MLAAFLLFLLTTAVAPRASAEVAIHPSITAQGPNITFPGSVVLDDMDVLATLLDLDKDLEELEAEASELESENDAIEEELAVLGNELAEAIRMEADAAIEVVRLEQLVADASTSLKVCFLHCVHIACKLDGLNYARHDFATCHIVLCSYIVECAVPIYIYIYSSVHVDCDLLLVNWAALVAHP